MFGSTAGLWESLLSSRRELSRGPTAADSTSLLWLGTGVGRVSLQCRQLPNTSCGHWNHGNVLPFGHRPAGSA